MIKLLIILLLAFYIFVRVGPFVMRMLFGSRPGNQFNENQHQRKSGVRANTQTNKPKRKIKKEGYNGGEYVDFEEVN